MRHLLGIGDKESEITEDEAVKAVKYLTGYTQEKVGIKIEVTKKLWYMGGWYFAIRAEPKYCATKLGGILDKMCEHDRKVIRYIVYGGTTDEGENIGKYGILLVKE